MIGRMLRTASRLALVCLVAVTASRGAPSAASLDDTRAVYVSALDATGAPIRDLTAADLSIKEDDRVQPIASLGPAMARMTIAALVDDTGFGIDQFRLGLARMINRLILDADFSIVGLAGQNRTLVDFTQRSDALVPVVRGLRARPGERGQHVIEAVSNALAAEERREAVRPVIVVITNQMGESGSGAGGGLMDRLARAGAVLHVIEVVQPSRAGAAGESGDIHVFSRENDAADAERARSQLLGDGPAATGGRRQQLLDVSGVPPAAGAIAEELAAQYVLVFHSNAKPGETSKIAIATTRAGVRIHAPARAGSRPIR